MEAIQYYGTGKRKTAIARVYVKPGSGQITVNDRKFQEYFPVERHQKDAMSPLHATGTAGSLDVEARVHGGGIMAQSQALRHGISRALLRFNAELRPKLKAEGLLTRDSRTVERKKYGQPGARKRFQYSKR
jgi:small subunit ribosomal protein S9